jgi:hypothetical protein
MLTIGVALGVLVLVFQDNRFESLVYSGAHSTSRSPSLFAVTGLSTDYGVFLPAAWRRYDERSRVLERSLSWSKPAGSSRRRRSCSRSRSVRSSSQMVFIKEVAVGTALAVLRRDPQQPLMPALPCSVERWRWSPPAGSPGELDRDWSGALQRAGERQRRVRRTGSPPPCSFRPPCARWSADRRDRWSSPRRRP